MATKSKPTVGKKPNAAGTRKGSDRDQFWELVVCDEPRLHACQKWLSGAQYSIQWLIEAVRKCINAEKIGNHKQTTALAELRDAARKLSDQLCEGENHVNAVTDSLATRILREMYALQNPLIAMQADDWKEIKEESLDPLLATLDGFERESAHVAELVDTALECFRRQAAKGKRSSKVKQRPGRKPDHERKEKLRRAVDEESSAAKPAGKVSVSGEWRPKATTMKIIASMKRGDTIDQIIETLGVAGCRSAANLRTIRSRARKAGLLNRPAK